MATIKQQIKASVRRVTEHAEYQAWLAKQSLNRGDFVAFNNSFVFRDLGTRKSDLYLTLMCNASGKLAEDVQVVADLSFNNEFKYYSGHQPNIALPITLDSAIEDQMDHIGQVVFVLISQVADDRIVEHKLGRGPFNKVIWDPTQVVGLEIDGNTIRVRDAHHGEAIWQELEAICNSGNIALPDQFGTDFARALEELQSQAIARLIFPDRNAPGKDGLTDLVVGALRSQRDAYASAVASCHGNPAINASAFNEVLRIAYNFANEAMTYLRLVINVSDLKPLVLWGTIGEQHALAEAFRELPFARSSEKPSLQSYIKTIGDARNSVFHNAFPFQKALSVELPDTALLKPELLFFSEYRGKTSNNQLTFRDKELVNVLLQFTRARSRQVEPSFWVKNLVVMDRTIELFDATSRILQAIHSVVTTP